MAPAGGRRNRYFPVHGGRGRPGARALHQRRVRRRRLGRAPGADRTRHGPAAGPGRDRRRGRHRSCPIGGSLLTYSLKEPVGVCAQIVPWNYPLLMAVWKLSPALAAGCTVVLKPDPQTPLSVLRIAELATQVGFPPGTINIVPGEGPTAGAYLVKHPGVDKVAFTGSTKTGGEIMRLCSEPIKRVTLELGGKSPNLLFADANLADAIPASVWAIFASAGQSCEAR